MTVPSPPPAESRAQLEFAGPGDAFTDSVREHLDRAASSFPTGIVNMSPLTYWSLARYDGLVRHEPVSQEGWEQAYGVLRRGEVSPGAGNAALPALEDLKQTAAAVHERGQVPIAIASIAYRQPTLRVTAEVLRAASANRAIRLPTGETSLLEERRAFIASALLPD